MDAATTGLLQLAVVYDQMEIWDNASRHLPQILPGSGGSAISLVVSPGSTLLALLSDCGQGGRPGLG